MLTSFILAATIATTQTFPKITPAGEVRVTITKECDERNICTSSYSEEPVQPQAEASAPTGQLPEEFTIPEGDRE
jgi:hypothetical protein